mmetsp:Transcript_27340/g.53452  ORF Transcript_27340/g.53452 Transcript_27340/m.53452 type:complete len:117 (+) Transcript_27340:61-411(+)
MVVERGTLHLLLFATVLLLCSQYDKVPAQLYQRYQRWPLHRAEGRQLLYANASSSEAETSTEEDEVYKGPGKTFGIVVLVTSVVSWCVFTFGSIAIGNYILSKNAGEQSEDPTMQS